MKRDRVLDAVALVLLCCCAFLSGLLELTFLGEFYAGTAIVPVTIAGAIVGNILLPVWGFRTLQQVKGALLPVLSWLIAILALTMYNRPEGDLFVLGAYYQDAAFYGLLLAGAACGFGTVVVLSGAGTAARQAPRRQPPRSQPPRSQPQPPRPRPTPTKGGGLSR
jgi:hypothetical protein